MTESVEDGQSKDETRYAPSVFISHKRGIEPDDGIARSLANDLEKLGCSVYLDINRPPAIEIDNDIPEYLDSADFVIALISAAANDSDWVKSELNRASSLNYKYRRPHIVPIRLNFTDEYSPRLAAILERFDPIYSSGSDDPLLLEEVKSALGLGRAIRRIMPRKRSLRHRWRIVGVIGLGFLLIFIAWLAGWQDGYSPPNDPFDQVLPQPSESTSTPQKKTNVPNTGSNPNVSNSSGNQAPISVDATLLNELRAAHNQTRMESSESNEKARQLYRNTLNNLPSVTRKSLSPTCASLLRDAEADYQRNHDDAALRKYDSFFTTCIAH